MKANPDMLILAREAKGFTQKELAEEAGISQSLISKYESGVADPTEEALLKIARALDVLPSFFEIADRRYRFGSSCTYHRRRQSLPMSYLTRLLADVNMLRIHVSLLTHGVEVETSISLPSLDIADFDGDIVKIAKITRHHLGVPPGPVANLIASVEATGAIVVKKSFGTRKLDAISQWLPSMRPVFLLNADAPVDRQRWSCAHELGHLVMHRSPTENMEVEADQFASEFLLPREDILPEMDNFRPDQLNAMKMYWRVSMAALIRRAHTLGKISDSLYRHLNIRLSSMGYKMREPDTLSPEEPRLLQSIFDVYRTDLNYSDDEIGQLLGVSTDLLARNYGIGTGRLRLA